MLIIFICKFYMVGFINTQKHFKGQNRSEYPSAGRQLQCLQNDKMSILWLTRIKSNHDAYGFYLEHLHGWFNK